jgi:hypothetical protein
MYSLQYPRISRKELEFVTLPIRGKDVKIHSLCNRRGRGREERENILGRCWNLLTSQLTSGKRCKSAENIFPLYCANIELTPCKFK